MILAINYSDNRFRNAQKFNTKRALKLGVDRVIEYSYDTLPDEFKEKYKTRFSYQRGGGYWIWKPYIILDALSKVKEGDYVVYLDSGSALVQNIHYLIHAMNQENIDVMVFCITLLEKFYTKRDAFILMDCDKKEIRETPQICSGYLILKKSRFSCELMEQFMEYVADDRITMDQDNVMGKENYVGFVENRHDQTVLSLLCKKHGIQPFRDPSQWGLNKCEFSEEVNQRSDYPQVIESHRNSNLHSKFQLRYKKWYCIFDIYFYKEKIYYIQRMLKNMLCKHKNER